MFPDVEICPAIGTHLFIQHLMGEVVSNISKTGIYRKSVFIRYERKMVGGQGSHAGGDVLLNTKSPGRSARGFVG